MKPPAGRTVDAMEGGLATSVARVVIQPIA
jgi:hypothetical protein